MRKTVLILAAMVAVAAGALGAAVASGATHNAKEATAVVASHSVLLGDQKVESLTDQNGTQPQAWQYTATVTGAATDVDVYDAGGTATIKVGLYANLSSNTPGKLLAVGSIGKSVANAWNRHNGRIGLGHGWHEVLAGDPGQRVVQGRRYRRVMLHRRSQRLRGCGWFLVE